jgi:hypothetical protein
MHYRFVGIVFAMSSVVVACGSSPPAPADGGPRDSGIVTPVDAGTDAGSDGGTDSGPPPWVAPTDCESTDVDVYTIPPAIPEFMSPADRGRVISCAPGPTIDAALADTRARERGWTGATLATTVETTRVLYQVERASGEMGFSTGALYLPTTGVTDAPLFVFVAGSTGLGDSCAPSNPSARYEDFEKVFYPLIGSGLAVFVPDLIGLGTPGTMAWLEPVDGGRSVLDGIRAVLEIAPEGALSGEVLISGHSAGAAAALAAQSYEATYAPELDIVGVTAMAPAWIDTSLFGILMGMRTASIADPDFGWNIIYSAYYFVGHTAAYDGEEHAYDMIAAPIRDQVREVFESTCIWVEDEERDTDVREATAAIAPTVEALYDPVFRDEMSRCAFGVCTEVGNTWNERFRADRPALDPEGAEVTILHGRMDTRIALENVACPYRAAMTADPRVTVCIHPDATHGGIAIEGAPWLVEWAQAIDAGEPRPACVDTSVPLPDC